MKLLASFLLLAFAAADVYMHNPRGSNDRNCERNENRNNGNRLFDSQNNDKGGYPCPRAVGGPEVVTPTMYYYGGSILPVEWTNQHSCGDNSDSVCNIVIQYMCEDANANLRDGTPSDGTDAATDRMDPEDVNDPRYGYHETYDFYLACSSRMRNRGLFTADQRLGPNAINTRQNPNGNRRGWECPEERDYYPYWHPQPWKDVAILSAQFGDHLPSCSWFQENSQNVQKVGYCHDAAGKTAPYNNIDECIANTFAWDVVDPLGGGQPECKTVQWNRDNHLGNGISGQPNHYNWTLPNIDADRCVLRLRYNISTADIPWHLSAADYSAAAASDYPAAKQDPYVDPLAALTKTVGTYNLSLALNTNQYGRTFQDRSYVFSIRKRPSGVGNANIYNFNVRGKRGNIVQTYPAVEYDYVPSPLVATENDYIHIQWTGSDYNVNRNPNDAEGGPTDPVQAGNYRSDRNNMMETATAADNLPLAKSAASFFTSDETVRMAQIDQTNCLSLAELLTKNNNNRDAVDKDSQNCMKLNAAPTPYFDGGLKKLSQTGTFHFMNTRNNNFSNRSQKGTIIVEPAGLSMAEKAGIGVGVGVGGVAAASAGGYFYAKKNPGSMVAGTLNKILRK